MLSAGKDQLPDTYGANLDRLDPLRQVDIIICEICGKNRVNKRAHFRCYYCGKYTCFECAHYHAVFIKEPFTYRVHSMRLCPNCKIKNRYQTDLMR